MSLCSLFEVTQLHILVLVFTSNESICSTRMSPVAISISMSKEMSIFSMIPIRSNAPTYFPLGRERYIFRTNTHIGTCMSTVFFCCYFHLNSLEWIVPCAPNTPISFIRISSVTWKPSHLCAYKFSPASLYHFKRMHLIICNLKYYKREFCSILSLMSPVYPDRN